ncbi:MAG: hypothetical protein E7413_00925 [Ruminococcaceae bacterium]|nr:hypothetical protein [Oscillospiraceae bacterium]
MMYSVYPKMKRIGDVFELLSCGKPKRVIFDLSEDGTFYNTKIYIDIIDKSKDEEYEGYIECKSNLEHIENYSLVYDREDRDSEIFTITIPD